MTPARTSPPSCARWPSWRPPAGRRHSPRRTPWPPRILLVGASPDDRAALARAAAREQVGDALAYAPHLPDARLAALVRGARAAILPVLSEAAGFAAIDALACGTPIVASAVRRPPGARRGGRHPRPAARAGAARSRAADGLDRPAGARADRRGSAREGRAAADRAEVAAATQAGLRGGRRLP